MSFQIKYSEAKKTCLFVMNGPVHALKLKIKNVPPQILVTYNKTHWTHFRCLPNRQREALSNLECAFEKLFSSSVLVFVNSML